MALQDRTTKLNESGQAVALLSALTSCRNEGFNVNRLTHGVDRLINCVIRLLNSINLLINATD